MHTTKKSCQNKNTKKNISDGFCVKESPTLSRKQFQTKIDTSYLVARVSYLSDSAQHEIQRSSLVASDSTKQTYLDHTGLQSMGSRTVTGREADRACGNSWCTREHCPGGRGWGYE